MSYSLNCDWRYGFNLDPTNKTRVGYLTEFKGGGIQLSADIEVFNPMQTDKLIKCVAVLDSYDFAGSVADPMAFSGYLSCENAQQISAKLKSTLKTTNCDFDYYIVNYDEENKAWYEEAYPAKKINGTINGAGGDLKINIASEPTKVSPTLDVNVYRFYFEVVPAANKIFALKFATGTTTRFVRNWGIKIGK